MTTTIDNAKAIADLNAYLAGDAIKNVPLDELHGHRSTLQDLTKNDGWSSDTPGRRLLHRVYVECVHRTLDPTNTTTDDINFEAIAKLAIAALVVAGRSDLADAYERQMTRPAVLAVVKPDEDGNGYLACPACGDDSIKENGSHPCDWGYRYQESAEKRLVVGPDFEWYDGERSGFVCEGCGQPIDGLPEGWETDYA